MSQRVAAAAAKLEEEACRALEREFIRVAKPEGLRQEGRGAYGRVKKSGLGVCSRCKWLHGCGLCDEVKA